MKEDIVTIARLLMEAQSGRLHYWPAFAANGRLWTVNVNVTMVTMTVVTISIVMITIMHLLLLVFSEA